MAKIAMTSAPGAPVPLHATPSPAFAAVAAHVQALGSIQAVRAEIDSMLVGMRAFHGMEPDEVMRTVSGYTARLVELRLRIQRIEDVHRQWRPVRVHEVDPLLEELRGQFGYHSRLHSVRELDYRMSMGQP